MTKHYLRVLGCALATGALALGACGGDDEGSTGGGGGEEAATE